MAKPRIVVLVSLGEHPVSGVARSSRNDTLALALARRLAGGEVDVVHAGDPAAPALRDYLAQGAAVIEAIDVPPGRDVLEALAEYVRGYDVVLCGTRSESGAGSGLLPYLLAQALHRPLLPAVLSAEIHAGSIVTQQWLPKGRRREVAATLPAVVMMHPLATLDVRYVYARERAGQIVARVPPVVPAPLAALRIEPAQGRPRKLAARESRSGHARLLAAITMESRGGAVITEGSPHEKAQAVIAYLRTHSLIDY
ncbi:electron transfer flavoprotein subunit beta/FixA family protein [Achromobacter sp. MY14]|uniref:electron transfer flavoprotein subunit beta/FixA family protein n=1 Tax=Achromobacter TaxID=222 RepID=UPI001E339E34|nr:electron transfer flavoprotein subunit beta/FixA family protein [Achromobacter sp. MY14]MCD0495578.1 electron transfer flavoprotein subunit beta/FixA family protein [Achromobacter sp. MY14]